jgi:hypothetical protein
MRQMGKQASKQTAAEGRGRAFFNHQKISWKINTHAGCHAYFYFLCRRREKRLNLGPAGGRTTSVLVTAKANKKYMLYIFEPWACTQCVE